MTKTLTRADIAKTINSKLGYSQNQANDLLDLVLDNLAASLKEKGGIKLSGFGNFVVRSKKERIGRNPKTGISAKITARKSVTFSPSQLLKKKVNG